MHRKVKPHTPINYAFRNSNLDWIFPDSEDIFKKNFHLNPFNKSLLKYSKSPIEYRLNNYGFRTDDKLTPISEGNIYLGCSHTFGIGHHIENTWGYKLSKEVGGAFWNLAEPGSGVLTGYRYLKYWIEHLDVKNVFVFYPHRNRFEFFNPEENAYHTLTENYIGITDDVKAILNHKINMDTLSELGYNALKLLCNKKGVKLYFIDTIPDIKYNTPNFEDDEARDLLHMSITAQHVIFQEFLEQYNKQKL